MIRFWIGVGLGAGLTYWYLTGEMPLREQIEGLLLNLGESVSQSEPS